jgi:hypothetical protein
MKIGYLAMGAQYVSQQFSFVLEHRVVKGMENKCTLWKHKNHTIVHILVMLFGDVV